MNKKFIDTVDHNWSSADLPLTERLEDDEVEIFSSKFSSFIGITKDELTLWPSARNALGATFKHLGKSGRSGKILIPAFTCPVVSQVAHSSGLSVEFYDNYHKEGSVDLWGRLARHIAHRDDVIGIVVAHLFGIPEDFREILPICESKKITIIEDSSHCLGGFIGQKPCGTVGDIGVFSFNYDKPISLGWGAAMFQREPILQPDSKLLSIQDELLMMRSLLKFYNGRRLALERPHFSRVISGFSRVIEGALRPSQRKKIVYSPKISDSELGIGPVRARLGNIQLERYVNLREERNWRGAYLMNSLGSSITWSPKGEVIPAILKVRTYFTSQNQFLRSTNQLQNFGFRAGNFNWPAESLPSEVRGFEGVEAFANHGMDLPVGPELSRNDLDLIISVVQSESN